LAKMSDDFEIHMFSETKQQVVLREDKLGLQLREARRETNKAEEYTLADDYDASFTYRQLFLKLAFEALICDLNINHDFEMIYEFIKTFGKELTSVKLRVMDKTALKSNSYWLMAIIPKLMNLKTLKIYRQEMCPLSFEFFKFLQKATFYFQKNGGSLNSFSLNKVQSTNRQDPSYSLSKDAMYACLKCLPDV